jgi:hypothetical protein
MRATITPPNQSSKSYPYEMELGWCHMPRKNISIAQISIANSLPDGIPPFSGASQKVSLSVGIGLVLVIAVEFDAASICIQGIVITFILCNKYWTSFWLECPAIGLYRALVVSYVRIDSLVWWRGSDDPRQCTSWQLSGSEDWGFVARGESMI